MHMVLVLSIALPLDRSRINRRYLVQPRATRSEIRSKIHNYFHQAASKLLQAAREPVAGGVDASMPESRGSVTRVIDKLRESDKQRDNRSNSASVARLPHLHH